MRQGHHGNANVPIYYGTHGLFKKVAADNDLYQTELMDIIMCHILTTSSESIEVINDKVKELAAEYKTNKQTYKSFLKKNGYE